MKSGEDGFRSDGEASGLSKVRSNSPGYNLFSFLFLLLQDQGALKRFLEIKGIKELPIEEEPWEVPMPVDTRPEPSGTCP